MSIVFVLIPISLVLVGCAVAAFFWAVRTGQFDELDAPAWEILVEDHREERGERGAPAAGSADSEESQR